MRLNFLPTAALHFDDALLAQIDALGVQPAHVTLHVGAGTFQPVKTENLADHQMHSEWYEVPAATQAAMAACRARGGRVIAVGTTTVRTLESWALSGHTSGDTRIFIAGYEHVVALYTHAIGQKYRFFNYGDAMLLT